MRFVARPARLARLARPAGQLVIRSSCRSCTRESVSSATIAPINAIEHVLLGIPQIALSAEKGLGRVAGADRGPPLDQLVHRADREAETDHEEGQPLPPLER